MLSSNNLAKLLQRMLLVGNIMNEGTRRGGASGFTLDSLSKMVNTKGNFDVLYCAFLAVLHSSLVIEILCVDAMRPLNFVFLLVVVVNL